MEKTPLLHVQGGAPHAYPRYTRRWLMLAIIALLQMSNAMIWICFSPIANKTGEFFHVSDFVVNCFSLAFMVASVPLGPVASWLLDTQGLKRSVLLAACLNALGAWLRYAGLFLGDGRGSASLGVVFVGQLLAAAAQPTILDCPTMLAATWFGDDERAVANMAASVANPVGTAIGSFFPPLVVDSADAGQFQMLCLLCALPAAVALLLVAIVFKNKPPQPPSLSAEFEGHDGFWEGLRKVAHNRAYLLLMVAFGVGVGMFSALSTLLGQIVNAQGYSDDDAGNFGAMLIGAGLLGAVVCSLVADRTKRFKELVRICFVGATSGILMFTLVLRPNQFGLVMTSCAIAGFFTLAALPVSLELCVECTYPVKEGTSAGFMWMTGQIASIVFVFSMNALQGSTNYYPPLNHTADGHVIPSNSSTGYADMTDSCWVAVGAACFGSLLLFFFRSEYKRMAAEAGVQKA